VVGLLQRLLEFRTDDTPLEKLHKLEAALEQDGFSLPEAVPLFAALLSLSLLDRYPPLALTPQRQRQKILETLLAWLLARAQKQPVLLLMEDLQWIDPSSLELLSLLIDQVPTVRILTVLTFRPEFNPPWEARSHLAGVTLGRLARKQVEVMIERVARGKTLPTEMMEQIVAKTDGVPLFVEELTKMVLESGLLKERNRHYELTGPLPSLAIPATLHDSLTARLDRLGTAKETAQLGATLGREFSYELIQAVSPVDEVTLQRDLARLAEAELLYQRGLPPQTRYLFKHALIQEAAYQSLLKSTRQQSHRQIAQVLQERFPETVELQPELLAHHYTEAGLIEQAIPYWQQAGQRAAQRSANAEAISHLTKGLELLKTLPDTPERLQQELALQTTLGPVLMGIKGYAAPEVEATYSRARELCQQVGETPQLFQALGGLCVFYLVRAELQTARELAERCLRLAQSVQDPVLLLWAHLWLGIILHFLGELASARANLEQGIALYDPQQHRSLAFLYGNDPGVLCFCHAAWTLWLLGYPDQALQRNHEALTLAQGLSHPNSLACALNFSGWLHQYRRERQAVEERTRAMVALSTEQGFAFWLAWGTIQQGWALAEQAYLPDRQGQGEEGLTLIRQGIAALQAVGEEVGRSYCLALLAEVYGKEGQAKEGLAVLEEALALVHRTGGRYCEAELYRLKGQLTLKQFGVRSSEFGVPNPQAEAEAEACFHKAIEIARRQQAKAWELRAAMSLARLWQLQGKKEEARQVLAEIYGWFTEGFDTADLQDAQALLRELS
jgi:predicted ATPase